MARVLLFSRTTGYRHVSIEHAVEVLAHMAVEDGHEADHTEDPTWFTPSTLARYDVVAWVSVIGDVLDGDQREAFASWLADGGAWLGLHGATAAEESWGEFARIAGARFVSHPEIQAATVHVADATHPSTEGLPSSWVHVDEWYDFDARPAPDRTVLLTVDEATYEGGSMGADHPVAWSGPYHRGRTWYTSLGHTVDAYDDPLLRAHLRGGLRSLLG